MYLNLRSVLSAWVIFLPLSSTLLFCGKQRDSQFTKDRYMESAHFFPCRATLSNCGIAQVLDGVGGDSSVAAAVQYSASEVNMVQSTIQCQAAPQPGVLE